MSEMLEDDGRMDDRLSLADHDAVREITLTLARMVSQMAADDGQAVSAVLSLTNFTMESMVRSQWWNDPEMKIARERIRTHLGTIWMLVAEQEAN